MDKGVDIAHKKMMREAFKEPDPNSTSMNCARNSASQQYNSMKYLFYNNSVDRVNISMHNNNTAKMLEQSILPSYSYKQLHVPTICKMTIRHLKWLPRIHNTEICSDCIENQYRNRENNIYRMDNAYSMLPIIDCKNVSEASNRFLELSRVPEACKNLRQSGYISLLVQMLCSESDEIICKKLSMSLYNIIYTNPIEKSARRELKIFKLLEHVITYCKLLKEYSTIEYEINVDSGIPILTTISSLMKISFDEEHRQSMCTLGALQVIPNILYLNYITHGSSLDSTNHNLFRRYGLMALTNLTFGDESNKLSLCKQRLFMKTLISQLDNAPDDLLQVTASLIRNLSWRADNNMKKVLNEIGSVTALVHAAIKNRNENTLKSILSALWNLSAHCSKNKAEFCGVSGALAFLVAMLTYESPSKTLKIVENAGGILRNVSSHIAIREDYRQILRKGNCLFILLQHLKSESLTVVSNSCGSLWNLSARCHEDQQFLWNNGAVPMLRSLIHSKHVMIAEGSSAALKNLLNFRASFQNNNPNVYLKNNSALTSKKQLSSKECLNKFCIHQIRTTDNRQNISSSLKYHHHRRSRSLESIDFRPTGFISEKYRNGMVKYKSYSLEYFHDISKHLERSYKYGDSARHVNCSAILRSDISKIDVPAITEKQFNSTIEEPVYTSSYQETDLDQLTNFSLRYAENQIEVDVDETTLLSNYTTSNQFNSSGDELNARKISKGHEIVLLLEDSVKCYETEDTPYMTSNSTSVNDLTNNKTDNKDITIVPKCSRGKKQNKSTKQKNNSSFVSDFDTLDNPISYCEEGTPEVVSRHESLNSLLDISNSIATKPIKKAYYLEDNQVQKKVDCTCNVNDITDKVNGISLLNKTRTNSAQETPLMFSRRSSMDSLREIDVTTYDDISSIQSDFSHLASGVISPDIPDSPTQIVANPPIKLSIEKTIDYQNSLNNEKENCKNTQDQLKLMPLNNVFEDNLSTFNVENTPAQFSSATSLSNLSSVEGEQAQINCHLKQSLGLPQNISEGEEEETHRNYDEILLASCIDIGMNRVSNSGLSKNDIDNNVHLTRDEIKEYFTEDTPALFSQEGSNTNLSVLSIVSGKNDEQPITEKKHVIDHLIKTSDQVTKIQLLENQRLQSGPAKLKNYVDSDYNCMNNSLSSLSIDSDDDNHLLSQTIAAGYNRPKSNLGFIRRDASTHSALFSTSQIINRNHTRTVYNSEKYIKFNDSGSSNESSDSNDNQSKSLLELCIRSGMHKSHSYNSVKQSYRKHCNDELNAPMVLAQSNPNLRQLRKKKRSLKAKTEQKLLMDCINAGISNKTGNTEHTVSKREQQNCKK